MLSLKNIVLILRNNFLRLNVFKSDNFLISFYFEGRAISTVLAISILIIRTKFYIIYLRIIRRWAIVLFIILISLERKTRFMLRSV